MSSTLLLLMCWLAAQSPAVGQHAFTVTRAGEHIIQFDGRSSVGTWKEGSAPIAKIQVGDQVFHQPLFYRDWQSYRIVAGPLEAGRHTVSISLTDPFVASGVQADGRFSSGFEIRDLKLEPTDQLADQYAPIVVPRPECGSAQTDVPLLVYCETEKRPDGQTTLTYTTVFSNEDGGTSTPNLMARWGRTTDIEWTYRVTVDAQGAVVGIPAFQGADHKTLPFTGRTLGRHPILYVATLNNIFAPEGGGKLRFALAPLVFDKLAASRESVLDPYPWTNRVQRDELLREHKIGIGNDPRGNPRIADPRSFLYLDVEAAIEESTGFSAGLIFEDGTQVRADLGLARNLISRSGWIRTAIQLPAPEAWKRLRAVFLECQSSSPQAAAPGGCSLRPLKALRIDDGDRAISVSRFDTGQVRLSSGGRHVFSISLQSDAGTAPDAPATLAGEWDRSHLTRKNPYLYKHADLAADLEQLTRQYPDVVARQIAGKSVAGREISLLTIGRGPLRVLAWSQMHGDEPTATSALVDLVSYLAAERENPKVRAVLNSITLLAIPMLNPDGAELNQRRNLQFIDINRDARDLRSPEGQTLQSVRDRLRPDLGFNLHNQNSRTSVGRTGQPAVISLLAVAYKEAVTTKPVPIATKKICSLIHQVLSEFIPGQIARYDDEFNPRAFGDMLTLAGTPIVLIETGGPSGAIDELGLVRLNFVALLSALQHLANGTLDEIDAGIYESLRVNEGGQLFSRLFKDVWVLNGTGAPLFQTDLGIAEDRTYSVDGTRIRSTLTDVGDLEVFSAIQSDVFSDYVVVSAEGTVRPGPDVHLLFFKRERVGAADVATLRMMRPDFVYRNGAIGTP
ncbi:MAG: M14 family zinc carboxypeptidase [Acidobacteriota bacterium]